MQCKIYRQRIQGKNQLLNLLLMAERWVPSLSFFLVMVVLHSADASIPAMFILGDSTADVGTNSLLSFSIIRADFPFNGIDFPSSQPTGRFSNGFNTVDFLGQFCLYSKWARLVFSPKCCQSDIDIKELCYLPFNIYMHTNKLWFQIQNFPTQT